MIQLTRLNNQSLLVNCDLIKFVESAPDTVLTLVSGEKILVREKPEEVLRKIVDFRRLVVSHEVVELPAGKSGELSSQCREGSAARSGADRAATEPERGAERG